MPGSTPPELDKGITIRGRWGRWGADFHSVIFQDEADTFREELEIVNDLLEAQKDKKVLLYCTGGIRCEKASAYLKDKGFKDVNQLHGGILEYARQIKTAGLESKFMGKNFVFDERLGESVNGQVVSKCHQCGAPCDSHTNCENHGCHILCDRKIVERS